MARTHFYHTVLRRNLSTGDIEPLENIEAVPKTVNPSTGLETTVEGIAYAARTGGSVGSNITDVNGVVQFYLDAGVDYNVHFTDLETVDRIASFTVGVNSVTGAIQGTLATLQTQVNGIDTDVNSLDTLLHAITSDLFVTALREKLGVSDSSLVRRGCNIIPDEESRTGTKTAYAVMPTPDRVPNVVVPDKSILVILYQAMMKNTVSDAGSAAIFLGSNQLKKATSDLAAPVVDEIGSGVFGVNLYKPLYTTIGGLGLADDVTSPIAYTGDVATGQIFGADGAGGPCFAFVDPGTYTVSVQYRASSGDVTAKNRRLYIWTLGFDELA